MTAGIATQHHWYAVGGQDLRQSLNSVAPYLASVNVCGSRRVNGWVMPATIEPLDEGELDTIVVLSELKRIGYDLYVGMQGYSLAGDAHAKFRRSLAALHDIERRIEAHRTWGTSVRTRFRCRPEPSDPP